MDNLLFALDLTNFDINETPNHDLPDAEDEDSIPLQEHLARNEKAFAAEYGKRSLGRLNVVQAPSEMYALTLRHNFIKPQFYRPNDSFREASLASFFSFMETFRGEQPNSNRVAWRKVLESSLVGDQMRQFRRLNNEMEMSKWFSGTLVAIKIALETGGYLLSETEKLCGLGGALAYTDPCTHATVNDAAFLCHVHEVLKSNRTRTTFAGVELKYAPLSYNMLWYKVHPAALAQTLCALGSHPDCVVSLFLCNYGFRIFWRERLPVPAILDGREVPVYQHFTYPPMDAIYQGPHLCYCYSEDRNVDVRNFEGLRDLLRVMFEFVLTSIVPMDQMKLGSPVAPAESLTEYSFGARARSGKIDFLKGIYTRQDQRTW